MQWTPGGVSGDIEDRRGQGGRGFRGTSLGVGGTILLLLLSLIFHRDFISMFSGSSGSGPAVSQPAPAVQDSSEANLVQFVSFVLDDTQKTWERLLPSMVLSTGMQSSFCFVIKRNLPAAWPRKPQGLSIVLPMKKSISTWASTMS